MANNLSATRRKRTRNSKVAKAENAEREAARQAAIRRHDMKHEFVDSTNEEMVTGWSASLKTLLIINGGAAVAVMTFIGGLVSQSRVPVAALNDVTGSLISFAIGVVAVVVSGIATYLNLYFIAATHFNLEETFEPPYVTWTDKSNRLFYVQRLFRIAAFVSAFAALGLFMNGVLELRDAIPKLSATTGLPQSK